MSLNRKQLDELLSLEQKKKVLKQLGNNDLIKLFSTTKTTYKPIIKKASPLDQQVAIGITQEEKDALIRDVKLIKEEGHNCSVSMLVRSRSLGEIDLQRWKENALLGLKELRGDTWDKRSIKRKILKYMKLAEKTNVASEKKIYNKCIADYKKQLELIERPIQRKGFRLSGRVTLNEANHIRWRAARLHITVADYMRMLIFDHLPFTEADNHLSMESRIRFYISIIDVANNGWGKPPTVNECDNCNRYIRDLQKAQEEINRLKKELMNKRY